MVRAPVPTLAVAAAAFGLIGAALIGAATGTAAAGTDIALRIASLRTAGAPDLVVVVPPTLAPRPIPPAAFQVHQDGRLRHISVSHLPDEGLDVHVVLDTSVGNTFLAAEQAAASDLLRALPAQVRTAVDTSGGLVHAPRPGPDDALRALAQVRADPAATQFETSTTVAAVAASPTSGRRRILVLLTACNADTASGFPALPGLLATGHQQLDVVAAGGSCGPALAAQARNSGGLGVTGAVLARIPEAVDTVTYDILGQYHLTVIDAHGSAPLLVDVDYGGVRASATVALPTPRAAASPTAGHPTGFKPLAALSGLILIVTAAGFLAAFRHRGRLVPA